MKRGDVVLGAVAGDYGKPRPYLVVQSDRIIGQVDSVLGCPLSTEVRSLIFRVRVDANSNTGLRHASEVMIDKLTPLPAAKVRDVIGSVDEDTLEAVDVALRLLLDL